MQITPAEKERLLAKRAKRYLEAQGFKLKSSQGGGYQVISAFDDHVIAGPDFELTVEDVGRIAGICGYSTEANENAEAASAEAARKRMIDRTSRIPDQYDPKTGLPTPEWAAWQEQEGVT